MQTPRGYPLIGGGSSDKVAIDLTTIKNAFVAVDEDVGNLATAIDNLKENTRYLSMPGEVVLFTGKTRWYPTKDVQLIALLASVDEAPLGQGIIAVIKKNGSIVDSIEIEAGNNRSDRKTIDFACTTNDYITVDVVQTGTTNKGRDLVIAIVYN